MSHSSDPTAHPLDLASLAEVLRDWLGGRVGADALVVDGLEVPSHGGMSHETILCNARWQASGGERREALVVRIEPDGPQLFPHYDLELQCRVMEILGRNGEVPVPEVLWYEPDAAVVGRPFYVMRRIDGMIPSDVPPYLIGGPFFEATPEEQARVQSSFVGALAKIHRLDWESMGLGFCARPEYGESPIDQEFGYWRHYLDWVSEARPLPVLEAAYDWCVMNRPAEIGPIVFNWGDVRYGNVIYAPDFTPRAVLDWEMALLGPGELDLGWFLFLHDTALMFMKNLPGFVDRDAVIAMYAEKRGLAPRDMHFYSVWAGLRAAAIQARIVQREVIRGRAADLSGQEKGPVVTSLRRLIESPRA